MPSRKLVNLCRFVLVVLLAWIALSGLLLAQSGTALQFNAPGPDQAKQFVNLGPNLKLGDPTVNHGAFTIETWFKQEGKGWFAMLEYPSNPQVFAVPLIAKGNWNRTSYFLGIDYFQRVLVADFDDGAGAGHPIYGTTILSDDKWYHAAAVYDGSTWYLYLDGHLEATATIGSTPRYDDTGNTSLATAITSGGSIGMWSYNGWFQGSMDEARFWNVARTAEELSDSKDAEILAAPGLVARYGLNEGSGTVARDSSGSVPAFDGTLMSHNDDTGGGNPATWLTGSPFKPGRGKLANRALGFNLMGTPYMPGDRDPRYANAYLDMGTAPALGLSTFTIEAWINWAWGGDSYLGNVKVPPGTGKYGSSELYAFPIAAKGNDSGGNYYFGLTRGAAGDDAPDAQLVAFFQDRNNPWNFPIVLSNQRIAKNGWHHVAVTFDGIQLQLYIDGVADAQTTTNGAFPNSDSRSHFSIAGGPDQGQLAGSMEQVHVWNYARSLAQIADNRTVNSTTPESGLLARWSMDDGGVPISDLGGSGGVAGLLAGTNWVYISGVPSPLFNWTDLNHTPVVTDPGAQTNNQGDSIALQIQATDEDGDALAYSAIGLPPGLSIFSGSGLITGTATTSGTYNVTVTVTDNTALVNPTFVWTINHVSLPPSASPDTYSMVGDGSLVVDAVHGVLANDFDPNGMPLTAVLVSNPGHGSVTLNADGSFTYIVAGYSGPDTFTYQATDGTLSSTPAVVTINISPRNYPPGVPVLVAPSDGASGVPTPVTLDVTVADPNQDELTVNFYGKKISGLPSDFTIVMLPDTQWYSSGNPEVFNEQTQWAVDNRQRLNIQFVTQVGDITNGNSDYEWQNASHSMGILDAAGIPNNFSLGNHDCCDGTQPWGSAGSDQYFPVNRYAFLGNNYGYLGSDPVADADDMPRDIAGNIVPNGNRSNYELFSVGYLDFIVLHLELDTPNGAAYPDGGKSANVMHWADRLLTKYSTRKAIISMHVYIEPSGGRATAPFLRHDGTGTSAEQVWQQLIFPHCNVVMTQNGHDAQGSGDEGMRVDNNACGKPVYQIMFDPEDRDNWFGDGWMRYYTFHTAQNTIEAFTYSPYLNQYEEDPPVCCKYNGVGGGHFTLNFDMGAPDYTLLDTKYVASGSHATTTWSGLDANTQYSWYADVSDGINPVVTSPAWTFTTTLPNHPPVAVNDSYSVNEGQTLTVAAITGVLANDTDADGDTLHAVLVTGPTHGNLTLNDDGSISYIPSVDFAGSDAFTYKANDGKADSNIATATISVLTTTGVITTPAPGATLTGSTVTFTWTAGTGSSAYWLDIGNVPGGNQYYQSGNLGNVLTTTANGLPTNGGTVYVTLYSSVGGQWISTAYTYTAFNPSGVQGVITSPTPGSTLSGNSVTFTWSAGTGSSAYWLDIGNVPGGNQYYQSGNLGNVLTTTGNGLPTNGSTVYVTLYSSVGGQWLSNAYTYTAFSASGVQGVVTSPSPGSTLSGSSATFTWTAGAGSSAYWLDIGNVPGGNQYSQSGNLGNVLTTTANGLPTDGSTVYVTLYSSVAGQWLSNAYTYTAFSASGVQGVITSPSPGSTLTGSSVTFIWSAGAGASAYWLDAGSSPAGNQYYQSGNLGNVLTTTVNGLPTDGSTVYVTLYSLVGGQWLSYAYTYTAYGNVSTRGAITTPAPGSTLSGSVATFTWSAGTGATAYWLDIGNVAGGNQYYQSGNLGNVLTTTVYSLPADGSIIYSTLYSYVGGQWLSSQYTYVSGP